VIREGLNRGPPQNHLFKVLPFKISMDMVEDLTFFNSFEGDNIIGLTQPVLGEMSLSGDESLSFQPESSVLDFSPPTGIIRIELGFDEDTAEIKAPLFSDDGNGNGFENARKLQLRGINLRSRQL